MQDSIISQLERSTFSFTVSLVSHSQSKSFIKVLLREFYGLGNGLGLRKRKAALQRFLEISCSKISGYRSQISGYRSQNY
jgi:hypothetical protein